MSAPKLPSIFKINRHKRFAYKARYFNERKERLEDRRKEIAKELKLEKQGSTIDKGFLKERRSKAVSQSNGRVIILLAIFMILAYLIFYR